MAEVGAEAEARAEVEEVETAEEVVVAIGGATTDAVRITSVSRVRPMKDVTKKTERGGRSNSPSSSNHRAQALNSCK